MFPFQVGAYGTGACFAVDRALGEQLGWFDEALGAGTPTRGGEDIDLFVRTLLAGRLLVNEPSAIVWHRHRSDLPALQSQARGYGMGLGAWLAKVAMDPALRRRAASQLPRALKRVAVLARGGSADPEKVDASFDLPAGYTARLGRLETRSILTGPAAYLRARREVAARQVRPSSAADTANR